MLFRKYFSKKIQKKGLEIEDVTLSSLKDEESEMTIAEPVGSRRFRLFGNLAILVFLILGIRVFYLQIVRGDYYEGIARENRVRFLSIEAPRGLIFDRNGKRLVQNIPSFDIVLIPSDLPKDPAKRGEEIEEVARIFNLNSQSLSVLVNSQNPNSLEPVLIKENVTREESLIFSEHQSRLGGFQLNETATRQYEKGAYFSSVLGYVGKITRDELQKHADYLLTDYIGKTGLEASYERYLRGVNGKQKAEVDSLGNVKKNLGIENPINGDDLYLGLDAELQEKIQSVLEKKLEEMGTRTAAVVAIDPRNGEVLALVSLPSYDNNLFARGISSEDYQRLIDDKDKPMFNRAIAGEYPPGSTWKPLVAAAALEEKLINSSTTVECRGGLRIGSYNFPDWKAHGLMDVRKAIAESCDVFFYSVGGGWGETSGLGVNRMKKYADFFGLGKITGIDIPGEAEGLVPDREWKETELGERWYVGDDYHSAIGQGFVTVTPLQLANYTAAIANGGIVYQPHLVRFVKKADGTEERFEPRILNRNFVSSQNLQIVREGMRQTVMSEKGTARQLRDLAVAVAGKTGTAQFGNENKTHGWFISFAPYDNPEIAMVVLVEGGGEGHSTAVPVAKEIYEWYFNR